MKTKTLLVTVAAALLVVACGRPITNNGIVSKAFIASSEGAYDELNRLITANDRLGINLLVASGRVRVAPDNTHVLILDSAIGRRRVRIVDGPYSGETGWIAYELVQCQPADATC